MCKFKKSVLIFIFSFLFFSFLPSYAAFKHFPIYGTGLRNVIALPETMERYAINEDKTIYHSSNGGSSWQILYSNEYNKIEDIKIVYVSQREMYDLLILERGLLYRSDLDGNNVKLLLTMPCSAKTISCIYRFISDPTSSQIIIEMINLENLLLSRVYFTKDEGITWDVNDQMTRTLLTKSSVKSVWWSGFYRSNDNGQNWSMSDRDLVVSEKILSNKGNNGILPLTLINPTNKQDIIVKADLIYRSFNGGDNFSPLSIPAEIEQISFGQDGKVWMFSTDGKLFSDYSSTSLKPQLSLVSDFFLTKDIENYGLSVINGEIWIGAYRSIDNGQTFELMNTGINEIAFNRYFCLNEFCDSVIISTNTEMYLTEDGGISWDSIYSVPKGYSIEDIGSNGKSKVVLIKHYIEQSMIFLHKKEQFQVRLETGKSLTNMVFKPIDDDTDDSPLLILYGARNNILLRSLDNGQTWEYIDLPFDKSMYIHFIKYHPLDSELLYMGLTSMEDDKDNPSGFFVSEDNGSNWTEVNLMSYKTACNIHFHQFRSDYIYVVALKEHEANGEKCLGDFIYSSDRGIVWNEVTLNEKVSFISSSTDQRDDVFAVLSSNQIAKSNYQADSWFTSSSENRALNKINYIIPNTLILGTNHGLWNIVHENYIPHKSIRGTLVDKEESSSEPVIEAPVKSKDTKESVIGIGCQLGFSNHTKDTSNPYIFLILILSLFLISLNKRIYL